jgi:hypothetical protein
MNGKEAREQSDWQELLRECVLFGLLFRAVMNDMALIDSAVLKLSYQPVLDELSRWAERQHHRMKRQLQEQGCRVLQSKKQGSVYTVQVSIGGYRREAIYSIEVLHAECEERMRSWAKQQSPCGDLHAASRKNDSTQGCHYEREEER